MVDTGVFGARLAPRGGVLVSGYRSLLEGRPIAISFVTVAEMEFGARRAGWGEARLRRMRAHLAGVDVVWPDSRLVDSYADLRAWCVARGHGLGQRHHEADRWIAATALYLHVPLVTHDAAFRGIDNLTIITRL